MKNLGFGLMRLPLHNPMSPLLLGDLKPDDTVIQGVQKSFLAKE